MISSDFNRLIPLIDSALTVTADWQDFGPRICTKNMDDIALWVRGSLNDSDKIQIRTKCYDTVDSEDEYYPQIQLVDSFSSVLTVESFETSVADLKFVLPLGVQNLSPFIQLEIKAGVAGATPAQIDKAHLSFNRG